MVELLSLYISAFLTLGFLHSTSIFAIHFLNSWLLTQHLAVLIDTDSVNCFFIGLWTYFAVLCIAHII